MAIRFQEINSSILKSRSFESIWDASKFNEWLFSAVNRMFFRKYRAMNLWHSSCNSELVRAGNRPFWTYLFLNPPFRFCPSLIFWFHSGQSNPWKGDPYSYETVRVFRERFFYLILFGNWNLTAAKKSAAVNCGDRASSEGIITSLNARYSIERFPNNCG